MQSEAARRPFRILGVQQIAVGALDRAALRSLWVDLLGLPVLGTFRSAEENVDEDILRAGAGALAVEIDLMQPIDANARPRIHEPALNHVGLWVDDLRSAVAWLSERGVRFAPGGVRRGASGYDVCFIHPKSSAQSPIGGLGVLIELVQAPPPILAAYEATKKECAGVGAPGGPAPYRQVDGRRLVKETRGSMDIARARASTRKWTFRIGIGGLAVGVLGLALYTWATLNYAYSAGERVGYVQKISKRGWLCKTNEGDLAMVNLAGQPAQMFAFTVRDDKIVADIEALAGHRVALQYEEHRGVPSSCFGDTSYFVVSVQKAE